MIHKHVVKRAIDRVRGDLGEGRGEELRKLTRRRFTAGHREFAMFVSPQTRDVALDFAVVGRIRDDELGSLLSHQSGVASGLKRHHHTKSG